MKRVKNCVPLGAQFFIFLFSSLLSFNSLGHRVVLSEYTLQYENGYWILSFDQKTSQLRDAIYASNPDLKGINLNSDVFLEATENYIMRSLILIYDGETLRFEPQKMRYGGLRFESRFIVEGLDTNPDYLVIKVDGFDAHEHSVVLFRFSEEDEAYLNYFNQDQRLATLDFATHRYVFEEIVSSGADRFWLYAISALVLLVLVIKLVRMRAVGG